MTQANSFCRCIKSVKRTVKLRTGRGEDAKESAAIAICTRSMLQTKGRTLKKVRCLKGKPVLQTQKLLRKSRRRS